MPSVSARILVTGATGFLGTYLCREMHGRGLDLTVLARSPARARWLLENDVPVRWGDITSKDACAAAVEGRDVLIHLAAAADVSDPAVNRRVNIDGLQNVLQAAQEGGVKRIVFLSSTCAGRHLRDAYGDTKLEGEGLVKASGLEFTILRPTMIYGRGSKEFDTFINTIRWSPVIPLIGTGRNVVQPVHVEDAVEVILQAARSPQAIGKTYDLAGATSISFDDFVRLVRRTLRLGPRLVVHLPLAPILAGARLLGKLMTHVPLSVDQVMAFVQDTTVDTGPLRRDFAFVPRGLPEGLAAVLWRTGPAPGPQPP
jgi:nucleoside-diphosphate-sugar epimerase